MKDTNKRRIFIVSFGNSRQYKVTFEPRNREETDRGLAQMAHYEKELNDYLAKKFPGDTFAYYTTPRITEVSVDNEAKYEDYPTFDERAVEEVKHLLEREIEVMNDDRMLNSNDPWGTTPSVN